MAELEEWRRWAKYNGKQGLKNRTWLWRALKAERRQIMLAVEECGGH